MELMAIQIAGLVIAAIVLISLRLQDRNKHGHKRHH